MYTIILGIIGVIEGTEDLQKVQRIQREVQSVQGFFRNWLRYEYEAFIGEYRWFI